MQLDVFEARFADAVERSFRDEAIRTAVLIDDQFPDYLGMREASDQEFTEIARAKNIYGFMHGKGLICDIQNWRVPDDTDVHLLNKVRKSDLILLDYQLGAGGAKAALKILRHLAVSTHFNLVVLYTAEASSRVALAVAAAMRGAKPPEVAFVPSEELLEGAEEVLSEERFRNIDAAGLRAYLTDRQTPWVRDLAAAMTEGGIPLQNVKALADHIARRWVETLIEGYELESDVELPLGCNIDSDQPLWVHCGSCFVAVVAKLPASSEQDEGEYVWDRLGAALRAWRPNLYRLILSEIQNALELEAVAHHEDWLNDELALGLGLYLLESDDAARDGMSPSDVEGTAQSLIDRFVDLIRRRLATHERISRTAVDLLGGRLSTAIGPAVANENARHVRARELAHIPVGRAVDWQRKVVPAVNAFMVSDAFRGGHVTTGTVLRGPAESYWLCASPACDLVPREDGPVLVQLIRLERMTAVPPKFTAGEFVVIGAGDDVLILRALEAKARQPSLTTLVLPAGTRVIRGDGAAIVSGWIANDAGLRAASIIHGFGTSPAAPAEERDTSHEAAVHSPLGETAFAPATPTRFVILSQLRSAFAARFLIAAGQHQSRMGVDYVDL